MVWKPDYLTVQELKDELKITDGVDDVWCALVVTGASRAVDRHCLRQFGLVATPEPRYYRVTYRAERDRWVASIDDVQTEVGMAVAVETTIGEALTGYLLEPRNAAAEGKPWTRLALAEGLSKVWGTPEPTVAVTARWGWSAVPATVKLATLLQAMRFYARRDSPYGVAGSPDLGSELRLLSKVDPDVGVMLVDFIRKVAAQ